MMIERQNGNLRLVKCLAKGERRRPLCKCISYNRPADGQTDREAFVKPYGCRSSYSIDKCIVGDLQKLWDNKIETKASCCGHNVDAPTIILAKVEDLEKAHRLLPAFDFIAYQSLYIRGTGRLFDRPARK